MKISVSRHKSRRNFVLKSVYKTSLSFTFRIYYLSYTSIKRLGDEEAGNKDKLKQKQNKTKNFSILFMVWGPRLKLKN